MFICICNAIRETDLRRAAHCCNGNAETVYAALGKLPQCGQCLEEADHVLIEERTRTHADSLAPA